jgi:hypothetical protein
MDTYSHSGSVPIRAAIQTLLGGIVAAVVGGIVYAYAFYWIPLVYVNCLVTLGFAVAIGVVISNLAIRGKIRNNLFLRFAAFLAAIVGLYVYWAAYLWALVGIGKVGMSAFSPLVLASLARVLFEKGSWGLTSGEMVTGWFLVAFWVAEVGVVLWISQNLALASAHRPFCELCNEWTNVETDLVRIAGTGHEPAWQKVLAGDLPSLAELPPAEPSALQFVRLDVARCPHCEQSRFLSAFAVQIKIDKKGNESKTERRIIQNAKLTPAKFAVVEVCAQLYRQAQTVPPAVESQEVSEVNQPSDEANPIEPTTKQA